jgi:3-oxoadipate enol-lactonase
MPYLEREDSAIYYEVYGSGKPLVFIHGAAGNTLSWWQQVDFFAQYYQVILLDLRGWGRSHGIIENQLTHATDLHNLLTHLGITTCAMVGQSLGGGVVSAFCQTFPRSVVAAILCGATAHLSLSPELEAIYRKNQQATPERNRLWREGKGSHPAFGKSTYQEHPELARLFSWINSLNPARSTPNFPKPVIKPTDLPSHCLFISGTEDQLVPTAVIQGLAELVPNAEFLSIPKCGHSPYFERPEIFNAAVLRFLQAYY